MDVLVDLTPLDSAARFRGIGHYVRELGRALAALGPDERRGLDIRALTSISGARVDTDLAWPGAPDFRTYPSCHRVYRWRRRLRLDSAAARTGARLLHRTDAAGSAAASPHPTVVSCHDLIPLVMHELYLSRRPWARSKQRMMDRRRYGRALRIVAASQATKRDLIEQIGLPPERIDVVLLGVDHDRFHAAPAGGEAERVRATLGTRRPFLLYVGGGDERKNVPHLVHAFARSGVASDVDLVLVGDLHRTQLALVRAAIDAEGVGDAVRIVGYASDADVAAAYRACMAHVCPSLYEGFGLTVAESMACGAPTITTSGGSLAEVAGDAALVVAGTDVDETAESLRRVVSDSDLRADLSRRGIAHAAHFRWDRTARETIAAYRRALDELDAD